MDTWRLNQEPMTQKMLELSQKFPFPGKRRLRSEVAEEQSHSDEYVYKDKANEVRAKVVIAYWGLSLAHTNYDLTQKNKQFWEQVVQVTETRYGVGQGMQADVLQAQVELGNYLDRLFQWTQKQESLPGRFERPAIQAAPNPGIPAPTFETPALCLKIRRFTGPGRSPAAAPGPKIHHRQTGKGGRPGPQGILSRCQDICGLRLPGNPGPAR